MAQIACDCPLGAEITDLGNQVCPVTFGLINKVAFQRLGTPFPTEGDLQTQGDWTTLLAASDDTKVQVSPKFASTEITPTEPITFGGDDNTTPDGETLIVGETTPTFTALFQDLDPDIKLQLIQFSCESNLGVYLFTDAGVIVHNSLSPFPMRAFFMGSRGLGGRTEPNQSQMQFNMDIAWDNLLQTTIPNFDVHALTNP